MKLKNSFSKNQTPKNKLLFARHFSTIQYSDTQPINFTSKMQRGKSAKSTPTKTKVNAFNDCRGHRG